jgi:hypothetical protein
VRQAQRTADPRSLAAAHRALELAQVAVHQYGEEALETARPEAEEQDWAAMAAEERELVAMADRVRLSAAFDVPRSLRSRIPE